MGACQITTRPFSLVARSAVGNITSGIGRQMVASGQTSSPLTRLMGLLLARLSLASRSTTGPTRTTSLIFGEALRPSRLN